ncbi:unnamed protein product [Allacma fusca]|uniref:ABC1 atypical kinase-like domain-containing protein n=1 Tax=Allacma fusca TaxID=39272 RepID=A0A8J2JQN2_9HEXA|nr:unnamed protein product [Allacma fusca]
MANNQLATDIFRVLNGVSKVAKSHFAIQRAVGKTIIENSSVLKSVCTIPKYVEQSIPQTPTDVGNLVQRASMVGHGVKQFTIVASKNLLKQTKSLGVEVLQQNEDGRRYEDNEQKIVVYDSGARPEEEIQIERVEEESKIQTGPSSTASDIRAEAAASLETLKEQLLPSSSKAERSTSEGTRVSPGVKPISKKKPTSQLSETSKERRVPASRIGRLVSYGGLAAGLGLGAVSEYTKRSLGLKQNKDDLATLSSSPFLTEANAQRIVDTMCRVRGAALKIGQILSIQDNSVINPELQKIFERVRQAADFMPTWQMEKMMSSELGSDWRSKLDDFDEKPFAAASIGQVHMGKLLDKRPVAIKIQYPGVAQGIGSDIDNLVGVLNVWNILPPGMFIDSIITVAKRELGWECDYVREAECAKKFRKLLEPYPDYYVPEVIDELTTKQVYTTELIDGLPVDQCGNLDQETRDRISHLLLDLFFRELFEFRFMQTDPNWSNFLYNVETRQVGLLDFGASRDYSQEFVDKYLMILRGAADNDRATVLKYSTSIGFLSGYESKVMENAHIDTVMLLGEAFRVGDEAYDFENFLECFCSVLNLELLAGLRLVKINIPSLSSWRAQLETFTLR